jgi:hypothetical protein
MKYCWLPALVLTLFCACKKEITYIEEDLTPEIKLEISEVHSDSSITLSWNSFTMRDLASVKLIRQSEKISNAHFEYVNEVLLDEDNSNTTSYNDEHTPFSFKTSYVIEVTTSQGNKLYSNLAEHKRTRHIFQGFVSDILTDTSANLLYVLAREQGIITVIDYVNEITVVSQQLDPNIGFCALGTFNSQKELYVPTSDGWVDIRNAATLELKDRIYVAGFTVSSVVAHNDQLFVSTTDHSASGMYSDALKVYDRATKQLISRTGKWDQTRLVLFPTTKTTIAEVTLNLLPADLSSHTFDEDGAFVNTKEDSYHGDYMLDGNLVKAFPTGAYLITSQQGSIFDSALVYHGLIDDQSIFGYSDFEFNSDGSVIYAAEGMEPAIKSFGFPSVQAMNTFQTSLPPKKIFRDGNKLYSLSADYPANISGPGIPFQFIIESFNL